MLRALLLATALLAVQVQAGFDTKCAYNAEWSNSDKKIEGVYAPLSGCQAQLLGFGTTTNDILIGGNGDVSVVGIPTTGGGKGCPNNDECMEMCQALCCMSKGCAHATVRKDTKTKDYVVYKEEYKYFYCRMYSSGTLKNSDTQSTCTKLGNTYCDDLAMAAFKMPADQFNYLVAMGNYATCPTRKLLALPSQRIGTFARPDEIKAAIWQFFKSVQANSFITSLRNKSARIFQNGQLERMVCKWQAAANLSCKA